MEKRITAVESQILMEFYLTEYFMKNDFLLHDTTHLYSLKEE